MGPLSAAVAAVALGTAVLGFSVPGPAAAAPSGARQVLRGALLQTTFPAGWTERVTRRRFTQYSLSSTAAPLNADAIPVAGAIGISIYVYPESAAARRALPRSLALADRSLALYGVIAIPGPAKYVTNIAPLRAAKLGGDPAARIASLYEYANDFNLNYQDDIVALHAHSVVLVELDTAPAILGKGEAALTALLRAWRWRTS